MCVCVCVYDLETNSEAAYGQVELLHHRKKKLEHIYRMCVSWVA